MRKLGKASTLLLSAVLATVVLMPMVNSVHADIGTYLIWFDYVYKGADAYYGTGFNIMAYLNGTTVTFKIPVKNNVAGEHINVTAIGIEFDTGLNITHTMKVRIDKDNMQYFEMSFTANVGQLPWVHEYTIRVKYEHETGTDEFTKEWDDFTPKYKFVVYSQDQKDIRDLSAEYNAYSTKYSPGSFWTLKGRLLATQAAIEVVQATTYLDLGNFSEAKAHYQVAVSLYEQAMAVEEDKGLYEEDVYLNATIKEADAAVKEADAAMLLAQATMNQAYGYMLVGLGFILIGIGAIIYGARKPKTS